MTHGCKYYAATFKIVYRDEIDMILELLFSLNLSDSALFEKPDIFEMVYMEMTKLQEPYGAACIGPKEIDLEKSVKYPIFSIWKTNNHDNKGFVPPEDSYVLFTSLETGRLVILPLVDYSGKLPLPEDEDIDETDYQNEKEPLSYSYESNWCDISLRRLNAAGGNYRIQVLCGKMISNAIEFSVLGEPEGQLVDLRKKELLAEAGSLTKEHEVLLVKSKYSPAIPERGNIVISTTEQKIKPDQKELFVNGSFNIETLPDFKDVPMEFSVIIQDNTEGGIIDDRIIVPCKFLETGDGFVAGYFSFDLIRYYYNKTTATFVLPMEICVTVVCGPVISNVLEVCSF